MTTAPVFRSAAIFARILGGSLRPVARVDVDILPGEIAGPVKALGFSGMQLDAESHFFGLQRLARFLRRNRDGSALAKDTEMAKRNIGLGGIKLNPGSPHRGQNSSPVGIF